MEFDKILSNESRSNANFIAIVYPQLRDGSKSKVILSMGLRIVRNLIKPLPYFFTVTYSIKQVTKLHSFLPTFYQYSIRGQV